MGRREVGGFDAVDPRYRALYDRALEVFGADDRVVRVEIHGSIANGTADAWSDLDLKIIVRDDAIEPFLDEWERWTSAITPTVLADRSIAPFIINTVTDGGLTFDMSVWTESSPAWSPPPGFTVGLNSGRRFFDPREAIGYAVEERLRGLAGPLIKILKRGQFALLFGSLGHTLALLTTVFLAETGTVPANPRHIELSLTDEQRDVLASLPPVSMTYDSLLAYELALAEVTITRARPLLSEWPDALEAVAARNLRQHLDVEVEWLHE